MNWNKKKIETDEVMKLHSRYKIDLMTCSILARRNITDRDKVKFYLENELLYMHSPFLFEDMELAVERIRNAQSEGEKVRIFGDRDVDGITSTVLLKNELDRLDIDVSYTIPDGDDPYGMTIEKVQKAKEDDVTLIITVDCGISEIEEINYAKQLGIDTIVLDHHISGTTLPKAYAIIDPKKEGTTYPFEHLAGCGVVAKTIWALRFSYTELYNEEFILLHSQPGNDTIIIQAAKIKNFMVIDRMIEEFNEGLVKIEQSKIIKFLDCNLPIFVLDENIERKQLTRAFGSSIEIYLKDIREDLERTIPSIKGKSLFSLAGISHTGRYSLFEKDELDVLIGIFNSMVLNKNPSLSSEFDKLLDLVAIGTVADLMPLTDENRILLKRGFKVLSNEPRTSLLPILSSKNLLGKEINATVIGWNISPTINSAGRMGHPKVAVEMLLAKDQELIESKFEELQSFNKKRQKLGEESWNNMQNEAKNSYEHFGTKMVFVKKASVFRGITGLMASRLMNLYKTPAMVIAKGDQGLLTGSVRSPKGFNTRTFFENFSDLFENFGGHACAGGFSLKEENLSLFEKKLEDVLDHMDCLEEEEEAVEIDCTIPEVYMKPNLINIVEKLGPYGQGNAPLIFQVQGATIIDYEYVNGDKNGSRNVRFTLSYGDYRWPCIFWGGGALVGREIDKDMVVDCVFRLGRNSFRHQETIQLTILDVKQSKK